MPGGSGPSLSGRSERFAVCNVGGKGAVEAALSIHHGLLDLGLDSTLGGRREFLDPSTDRTKIVFLANFARQFPELARGGEWRRAFRDHDILYQMEQLRPMLLERQGLLEICRDRRVWDFSEANVAYLAAAGIHGATHVPLAASSADFCIGEGFDQFDVVFYGVANRRRSRLLSTFRASGLRCAFFDDSVPVWGAERQAFIACSRVFLNVHFYPDASFESFRCIAPLCSGRCVVSERSGLATDDAPYSSGVCFADTSDLLTICRRLAADDALLDEHRQKAFLWRRSVRQSTFLAQALAAR